MKWEKKTQKLIKPKTNYRSHIENKHLPALIKKIERHPSRY